MTLSASDEYMEYHSDTAVEYHSGTRMAYHPDMAQYDRNLITCVGTRISHLPGAMFLLMDELCRRYRRSGRCVIYPEGFCLHKAEQNYYQWEDEDALYLPHAVVLRVSTYADKARQNTFYLSVEMERLPVDEWTCRGWTQREQNVAVSCTAGGTGQPQREDNAFVPDAAAGSIPLQFGDNTALSDNQRRSDAAARDTHPAVLVLRMNGSMKSRYYYTLKRFMNANRGKYVLPGMQPLRGRPWRVCVFDTEMERPYPIQFAGILLEKTTGTWHELDRFSTYIRLPKDAHLTRDVARVTKISEDLLRREGVPEKEADVQIQAFLARADVVCGHAVIADKEIMRTSFLRQQLRQPYSLRRHEMIDTQVILERLFHLDNAVKLEYAAEMTGIRSPEDVFHDARTDAAVTARLLTMLEPVFLERYQTEPVVYDAMMHAPQQTQLLSRLSGARMIQDRGKGGTHENAGSQ